MPIFSSLLKVCFFFAVYLKVEIDLKKRGKAKRRNLAFPSIVTGFEGIGRIRELIRPNEGVKI